VSNPASHRHQTRAALALRQQGEQRAARLPALLLSAERVANTVAQGVHGRRRVGQGETFWQFRQYETGDPLQQIDWRQSAKGDRIFVRELEWEAAQSAWIWVDPSPSMAWRSGEALPAKLERARVIAMAMAILMVRAGERVALLGSDQPPRSGRGALASLAARLSDLSTSDAPDAGLPPLRHLPRHAQLILVSDFLEDPAALEARLRHFLTAGLRGHLVQVLDPAELALPYKGRLRFDGLEGEESWLLSRVESVRDDYLDRVERLQAALRDFAASVGWGYSLHITERPAEPTLLALHQALSVTALENR
jgi:uncharacterized protein (DUF58 family)